MASASTPQASVVLKNNGSKYGHPSERDNNRNMGQNDPRGDNKSTGPRGSRRAPGTCLPKSQEIQTLTIKSDGLEEHIQYMRDHALIAKFLGF